MRVPGLAPAGIWVSGADHAADAIRSAAHRLIDGAGLDFEPVFRHHPSEDIWQITLPQPLFEAQREQAETLHLTSAARPSSPELLQETVLGLLAAPVPLVFERWDQLESHLRIRLNIAQAAAKTSLLFATHSAERPSDYWQATDGRGYVLREGVRLEDALIAATQPEVTGQAYGFSCYRASEYILLLGIAQEARRVSPVYIEDMERQCRQEVLRSDPFHLTYACEYGTMDRPIPPTFYIPGDRIWFKNPDPISSDVTGYEGSWVFYLGNGLFSNFWQRDRPFDLITKCLEIYHWRHAVEPDHQNEASINETRVQELVAQTRRDPLAMQQVLARMMVYRDPGGVYANGGCIDSTREIPRPNLF